MMILKTSRSNLSSNDQLSLDLPFAATKSLAARVGPTPTFTRASTATFIGSDGLIQTAAINSPRFDHDPVSLICRGLLIEDSRTNLLLNSAVLATQTRTVTAVAHTLSFYGTGTVVLSGAHSATVVGTGAYPSRRTLTFTPTSGSLTLTVTGTVESAQLEAGSFATSYIPTTTGSVVRSADVCSITGANFTSFWNTNEGAMFASGDPRGGASVSTLVMANSGANANQIAFDRQTAAIKFGIANSGTYTATIQQNSTNGSFVKISGAYATNNARSALNGVLGTPDTSVIVPTNLNRFNIGAAGAASTEFANGCISEIKYFRKPLSNAKLQALTV
jgi:primosomal replication protein N